MLWRTVPCRLLLILPPLALNLARWLSRPAQSAVVWPNVCDKVGLSPAGSDAEIERFAQNGVHFTQTEAT